MGSIEKIKASDGSGNANTATVQNSRSPGATTIIVDTVLGINPAGFAGTMGTPHTFTDPITSETITVISEATAVDFTGHVSGSNLEIDTIAPGYTDAGSAVGDIVIIKPTTQYADNLAGTLAAAHNDDGTLKTGIVTNSKLGTDISPAKFANPYKFSVYRNGAWNTGTGGQFNKVALDTKSFDTGTNFDVVTNNRFVAPIAGFYFFTGGVGTTTTNVWLSAALYKNGSSAIRGTSLLNSAGAINSLVTVSGLLQLAATDYVELFQYSNTATQGGQTGADTTYLHGFLVSAS